jgi:hypothetical protein
LGRFCRGPDGLTAGFAGGVVRRGICPSAAPQTAKRMAAVSVERKMEEVTI